MNPLDVSDELAPGDVLHHPAFGFAVVEQVDGDSAALRWERPGSAHPHRAARSAIASTWRRCDPRGFFARTVVDPDGARALFTREPLDVVGLILLDLRPTGATSRDDLREWLLDRRLLPESRFDPWWSSVCGLAAQDPRFEVRPPNIQLADGVGRDLLLAALDTPLPRPGTLPVSQLASTARRLAGALAEVHAGGEHASRDRAAVRAVPSGYHLGSLPGVSAADRREDVAWLGRLILEQILGPLPPQDHLASGAIPCLVHGLQPQVPPEILEVLGAACASDPALRPADGAELAARLAVADAVATHRLHAPADPYAQVAVGFDSHIGILKALNGQTNQDAFLVAGDPALALLVVADGISLSDAGTGDLASQLAVRTLRTWFGAQGSQLGGAPANRAQNALVEVLRRANKTICETALKLGNGDVEHNIPMGTTAVAALVSGNRVTLASLGDYRAYVVGAHGAALLTADQNLESLRLGEVLAGHEVEWDEPRHALTAYLGHFDLEGRESFPAPFTRTFTLLPGEWLVICSDGLCDYAVDEDAAMGPLLQRAVTLAEGPSATARAMDLARRLVDAANRGGGGDNVTVLTLTLSPDPEPSPTDTAVGS